MIEAMTIEATQFKKAAKKILRDAGIIQNTKGEKSSTGQRLFSSMPINEYRPYLEKDIVE
jgi:hypothetical protein